MKVINYHWLYPQITESVLPRDLISKFYIRAQFSRTTKSSLEISTPKSTLGKFGPKKSKLSVLPENWHSWYVGGDDSNSGLRFLKFRPQISFLGKFWSKKLKLSIFPEN